MTTSSAPAFCCVFEQFAISPREWLGNSLRRRSSVQIFGLCIFSSPKNNGMQTLRIQNKDIPRESRLVAARGGAVGRVGARYSLTPTCRIAKKSTGFFASQGIEHNCREHSFGSTNKAIPMLTDEEENPRLTTGRQPVENRSGRCLSP